MREPHLHHTNIQHTGNTQTDNAEHTPITYGPIDPTDEVKPLSPHITTINLGTTVTSPEASDVMMQKNTDPTPLSPFPNTRMRQRPPLQRKQLSKTSKEFHKSNSNANSGPPASTLAMALENNIRVRKRLPTPRPLGTNPIRIPHLVELMDTYTDEKFKTTINNLPDSWQDTNEKGTIVTKRQLDRKSVV
jgi:hypothetical protein